MGRARRGKAARTVAETEEERRAQRREAVEEDLRRRKPDFSKPGAYGEIPKPVRRWLDRLGATPEYGKGFVVDENGLVVDVPRVKTCPGTFWVAYHDQKPTKRPCAEVDYEFVAGSIQESALTTAESVARACETEGCRVRFSLEYISWTCYLREGLQAGNTVYAAIVVEVDCIEL